MQIAAVVIRPHTGGFAVSQLRPVTVQTRQIPPSLSSVVLFFKYSPIYWGALGPFLARNVGVLDLCTYVNNVEVSNK